MLSRPAPDPIRAWHYGYGPDQVADVYPAPAGTPPRVPVVLIHGGYWRPEYDRTHLRPLAHALAEAGHRTVSVEYRRRPGEPDAAVADVRQALAGLTSVLDRPAIVVGHSAGGHLALLVAQDPGANVRAVLALAPVADLELAAQLALDEGAVRAFLGTAACERADLDPARGPGPAVPTVVLHGEQDDLVPLAAAAAYCDATGVPLRRLAATGHFAWIDPTSHAWPVLLAELAALGEDGGIE